MKTALQATTSSVLSLALMAVALFWPAGTLDYWEGWVFFGVFVGLSLSYTAFVGLTNPEVLRRRLNAGPQHEFRPVQKIVIAGVMVAYYGLLVVSALDHRFGWSHVPTAVVVVGNVLTWLGLGIAMVVVVQNKYAAANVTVESQQAVVSTGLYGLVRHPMYFGALIMFVGIPLALESYWALVLVAVAAMLFTARIIDEEKALTGELAGYREYTQKVPSRLLPGVW
jgi:protein-S-isoprenylcysteine O-methyltransferase Ste14